MKIQPVSTWFNGEEQQADLFNLSIGYDNLETNAIFNYNLSIETPQPEPSYKIMYNILVSGSLSIDGQDYIDWSAASDANAWAYQWAATKLNLTLISDETIA